MYLRINDNLKELKSVNKMKIVYYIRRRQCSDAAVKQRETVATADGGDKERQRNDQSR